MCLALASAKQAASTLRRNLIFLAVENQIKKSVVNHEAR